MRGSLFLYLQFLLGVVFSPIVCESVVAGCGVVFCVCFVFCVFYAGFWPCWLVSFLLGIFLKWWGVVGGVRCLWLWLWEKEGAEGAEARLAGGLGVMRRLAEVMLRDWK